MDKVFYLRKNHNFENEKIKILYSIGDVSNALSVYLKDSEGKSHHVYWLICPDRCYQSFDKLNERVRKFVEDKVDEWLEEEIAEREKREQLKKQKEEAEKQKIQNLMDNF